MLLADVTTNAALSDADFIWRIISGSITILIAGAVFFVAYYQYKAAKDKLRLELFEKRYAFFREIVKVIEACKSYKLDEVIERTNRPAFHGQRISNSCPP